MGGPEDLGDVARLGDRAAVAEDDHVVADGEGGVGHRLDPRGSGGQVGGRGLRADHPLGRQTDVRDQDVGPGSAIRRASSSLWT